MLPIQIIIRNTAKYERKLIFAYLHFALIMLKDITKWLISGISSLIIYEKRLIVQDYMYGSGFLLNINLLRTLGLGQICFCSHALSYSNVLNFS